MPPLHQYMERVLINHRKRIDRCKRIGYVIRKHTTIRKRREAWSLDIQKQQVKPMQQLLII